MTRGRLAIHAHFYQPGRADPFTGAMPGDPAAAPFHDWNARIDAECYRPNAERGNLDRLSFDLGPTLAAWMERESPSTLRRFVAADNGGRAGGAIAQAFHHTILPLASELDRRTEIRWGLADFELRFGRPATGLWLPETAVDLPTLRIAAAAGIRYTILAPWQAADPHLDPRVPYRVDLGGGSSIVAVFYDARLSAAVSFDPAATSDARWFAEEAVAPRLRGDWSTEPGPLLVVATDGELYGHHLEFRDQFLEHLVAPGPDAPDRGFDIVDLSTAILEADVAALPPMQVVDRTSWSCHHGIARWTHECPDANDGRWKGPLRAALERLAAGVDALTEAEFGRLPGSPDPWAARDAYVGVVLGARTADEFASAWLPPDAAAGSRSRFLDLLVVQRWRLAMFASDGWFWEDPIRPETKQLLRSAARAARLVDDLTGSALERRLVADLGLLMSPSRGVDGAEIYRQALLEIGQPPPA